MGLVGRGGFMGDWIFLKLMSSCNFRMLCLIIVWMEGVVFDWVGVGFGCRRDV